MSHQKTALAVVAIMNYHLVVQLAEAGNQLEPEVGVNHDVDYDIRVMVVADHNRYVVHCGMLHNVLHWHHHLTRHMNHNFD